MTLTQVSSQDARMLHGHALEALRESRLPEAARDLRAAVLLAPRCAMYWNDLGVVMEALGYPAEALRCYRTALDREAGHPEARDNYEDLRRQLRLLRAMEAQMVKSTTDWRPAGPRAPAKCRAASAS